MKNDKERDIARHVSELMHELRECFDSGMTRSYEWRKSQLLGLKCFLDEREKDIYDALQSDFRKPRAEVFFTEIHYLMTEIHVALKHLKSWMRTRKVITPFRYQPGRSYYFQEPYGVVLVMGAWNYPLQLAIAPAINAIAAGNCVLIKPSEQAPAISGLLAEVPGRYLDERAIKVFLGGVEESSKLLETSFDYIFFTGGGNVGKQVMERAAKHLTPVTLELGGKNPCVVDRHTNVPVAARRVVWAKFLNAGQTCIAPDYVLVHRDVEEELLDCMKGAIDAFYGARPELSTDYPAIITPEHLERLAGYFADGVVVTGGLIDPERLYCAPTVLRAVSPSSRVMKEEIFGPILPVLGYSEQDEALAVMRSFHHPLAVYIFSGDRSFQQYMLKNTRSGGVCINDLMFQAAIPALPFGGAGKSGMGAYHGEAGFETFSHSRSVHVKRTLPENILRYPPFSEMKFKWLRKLFRLFG
ncbi:aldehyde dehydrogenase family protein [Prosthecochloris sp. SCSIO W1102]|uniref:aldehyde dehydrogenase family protein n=1 Tax=Prosthecochloris sp. SCSIO W1102 TaxID=2992243 RepID=UPI00223E335E|nr:aldehyde dehydrogenase family protein [Prosthecochloris sp. SCSIO W1102]UZJ39055.1 aldehyde dehydrogenase family protein [Prosthecochloris sp. SCSIO W1102]